MSDDTEPLCDSCGCAECEVDDSGLHQTPYGLLCGECDWAHILIDLSDTKAENAELRQRAERAEGENRKLRDAWPSSDNMKNMLSDGYNGKFCTYGVWEQGGDYIGTRDEAINAAAGITAADAAEGE